jgi:hypothetical protein
MKSRRPANKFPARCHRCRRWLDAGQGWLGDCDDDGHWQVTCRQCDRAQPPIQKTNPRGDLAAELCTVLKTWYRGACRRFHPDHGGSNAQQIVVNDCHDALLKHIETWQKQQRRP